MTPDLLTDPAAAGFVDRSHPERRHELAEEITALADKIREWQLAQTPKLSDQGLIKRYPELRSTRTYKRLLDREIDGLHLDQHLGGYRKTWAAIRSQAGMDAEPLYEDLTPAIETAEAVAAVIPRRDLQRLVLIEGPSGCGKSKSLLLIARRYEGQVARIEANETWRSLTTALGDMLLGTGAVLTEADLPRDSSTMLKQLIAYLNSQRCIVCIDEGQHMTPTVLNTVKTLLNKTDGVFIIAAIDTIWRKLTAKHWEEVRQLVHNRTGRRVRLAAPGVADAELFLARRVKFANGSWKKPLPKVCELARKFGHYAFLRRLAEDLAEVEGGKANGSDVLEAANALAVQLRAHSMS